MQSTDANSGKAALWKSLRISLFRFSDGPPAGIPTGRFLATRVTAWKIKNGSASVRTRNCAITARTGQWLVCLPGDRYQKIERSTCYVSMHFEVDNLDNAAEWTGHPALVIDDTPSLNRLLRQLQQTALMRHLRESGLMHPEEVPSTLAESLEFQSRLLVLFRELSLELDCRGVSFHSPVIHDARLRHSRQELLQMDLSKPFARRHHAAQYGLSAGQLDRLWRKELGVTAQGHYHQRRLALACSLLERGDRQIKEIAHLTGFRYFSRFCIWFHRRMGESPSAFRHRQKTLQHY
jgi:AraC-like DNA-binding protein